MFLGWAEPGVRVIVSAMTTLHLTHTVKNFDEWLATFNTFSGFRVDGGVRSCTVRHGVDDPNFVTVDLGFDTTEDARSFLGGLETEIWPNSPHIDGTPSSRMLAAVDGAA
jgi:hypothetical protein